MQQDGPSPKPYFPAFGLVPFQAPRYINATINSTLCKSFQEPTVEQVWPIPNTSLPPNALKIAGIRVQSRLSHAVMFGFNENLTPKMSGSHAMELTDTLG